MTQMEQHRAWREAEVGDICAKPHPLDGRGKTTVNNWQARLLHDNLLMNKKTLTNILMETIKFISFPLPNAESRRGHEGLTRMRSRSKGERTRAVNVLDTTVGGFFSGSRNKCCAETRYQHHLPSGLSEDRNPFTAHLP